MGKLGIANLLLVVAAIGSLGTASAALIDKGPGLDDIPKVTDAASHLYALKELNANSLKEEIADLDDTEKANLASVFGNEFDIPNDNVEVMIEKGLDFIFMALPFVLWVLGKVKPAPAPTV